MTSKGEWVVGDTLDTRGLNNEDYKRKYQQLQAGRRKSLEETQALPKNLLDIKAEKERPRKGDTADTEQTIQALIKNVEEKQKKELQYKQQLEEREQTIQALIKNVEEKQKKELQYKQQLEEREQTIQALIKNVEEKEQTIQMKENKKVRDPQRFRQQLEQKEREKEQEIQRYRHLLQEKEREEAEKEQEIQRYRHQLQENARELQEKERELQEKEREVQGKNRELQGKNRELRGKNRELQEKERELRQSQDAVHRYQQQVSTDDHWVINKDEVILTETELGRGSFAVVKVGTFRGLRVAVKSLHTIIISNYNRGLFSREMSIASRARHPNLVQFIGATKVGNPLILTELMSTSLYKELQEKELTRQQILSIAQDVALGLNYLHLFKPQPIIHRDVSSPNVLLKPSTGPAGYEAKVADYGTAKLQQGTSTGTVMPGNPAYAAPEARDPEQHSPAMDVYSYSVLLMEMTLCAPPEMTIIERERQSHNVSWSPMKSLIQRGLNTTRQRRPTMPQVIEALRGM